MATTEWIPGDHCGRRACDQKAGQDTQAPQITAPGKCGAICFLVIASWLFTGCSLPNTTATRHLSYRASQEIARIDRRPKTTVTARLSASETKNADQREDKPSPEATIMASSTGAQTTENSAGSQEFGLVAFQEEGGSAVAQPEFIEEVDAGPVQPIADASAQLSLPQILNSVAECFPEIEVALGEIATADGKQLASQGAFDNRLTAHSISQPLGFYQTYRNGIGIAQPVFTGGEVYGTYRIGDGNFEPWFGERETNEAGEFKAGFSIPLAKDRNIDARRANLFATQLQRNQLEFNVESRLLFLQRMATQSYWNWVAAGQAVAVQQRLLSLAQKRVEQIQIRVTEGDLAEIIEIDNERFIAKRKNDLIKARRSLEKAAIKLSLFWRDEACNPVVPTMDQLPGNFPNAIAIVAAQLESDIASALTVRPEITELEFKRREACVELEYAENLTLPKVDLKGFAGQDIGGAASSKGDKTPFELQLGVLAEVPLQRREGLGKIQAAQGKLTTIKAKLQMTSDKIRAEIQDAASAVNAAAKQIEQSQENLTLSRKSLELGRLSFEEGDIDLIALNIYETSVADAELQLLAAQFQYFFFRAVYQTAILDRAF